MTTADVFKLAIAAAAGGAVAFIVARGAADRQSERLDSLEAGQRAIVSELQRLKSAPSAPQQPAPPGANQPASPQLPATPLSIVGAASLGRNDAPLTMIEFSDFQCPFCLRHANQTFEQIKAAYVDTGKLRYVFRHFPIQSLHPEAVTGARAAECAGRQGKFWQFHKHLFANPKRMAQIDVEGYAIAEKLELNAFATCLSDPAVVARINSDLNDGSQAGVTGTPMFFVGRLENGQLRVARRLTGALPFSTFQQTFDQLLAGS